MVVRDAKTEDVAALVEIYNHEVELGTTNYEVHPQMEDERARWLLGLQDRRFPVLVAEEGGRVIGFGALTPFHPLTGYRFTVSGSLYVHPAHRRSGVGRGIARALFQAAKAKGFHSVLAGVNSRNSASIELLKTFGFRQVGEFREIGFKNGQWHDDICLQLILNDEQGRQS